MGIYITSQGKRAKALEEEWSKPITQESLFETLVSCGILNRDSAVAEPYKGVIVPIQK